MVKSLPQDAIIRLSTRLQRIYLRVEFLCRPQLMLWTAPATGITMCQSAVAVNRQEGAVL